MKINSILNYLDTLIPNPKCELNYNKDYELLISVMLSAQTTDNRVNEVTSILYKKYSSLEALKNADVNDIISIIKPIGTYRKKAYNVIDIANKLLSNGYNYVPNDQKFLETLNGVGRKTSNVVLSILYNMPYVAVDTHINRVSKRLGLADINDDVLEVERKLEAILPFENRVKYHHQLLLFGRYYCKAVKPLCENCKLKNICNKKEYL